MMMPASASPSPPWAPFDRLICEPGHETEDDADDAGQTEEQDAGAGADQRRDGEAVRLLGRRRAVGIAVGTP